MGFIPKNSTVDRILALRVLTERLRDFRIGLLAAYVDIRVRLGEPKCTLENPGLPRNAPKVVDLVSVLFSGTESAVRCDGTISDYFPVNTGVRQGCVLALTLFNTCIDLVVGRMSEKLGCVLSFGTIRMTEIDFVYIR